MALKSWIVRYRRSCEGEAVVDARTAEEAVALVDGGDFNHDTAEEMVDWEALGKAEENV